MPACSAGCAMLCDRLMAVTLRLRPWTVTRTLAVHGRGALHPFHRGAVGLPLGTDEMRLGHTCRWAPQLQESDAVEEVLPS